MHGVGKQLTYYVLFTLCACIRAKVISLSIYCCSCHYCQKISKSRVSIVKLSETKKLFFASKC